MPKFKIIISDLTFDTIIGILEKERKTKQRVIANVEIIYEKKGDDFINYADVSALIENTMNEKRFLLLEEALEEIQIQMKSKFHAISSMNLKLSKPDILDNCEVGVENFKEY